MINHLKDCPECEGDERGVKIGTVVAGLIGQSWRTCDTCERIAGLLRQQDAESRREERTRVQPYLRHKRGCHYQVMQDGRVHRECDCGFAALAHPQPATTETRDA